MINLLLIFIYKDEHFKKNIPDFDELLVYLCSQNPIRYLSSQTRVSLKHTRNSRELENSRRLREFSLFVVS